VSVRDLRSYYFSLVTGLAGTVLLIDDGIGERDRVAHELVGGLIGVQCGKDARFCGGIEFGCGLGRRGVGLKFGEELEDSFGFRRAATAFELALDASARNCCSGAAFGSRVSPSKPHDT
jgi:hypothetical protein